MEVEACESSPGTEWIILWLGEVQELGPPPGLEQLGMVVSGLAFGTQLSPPSLLLLLAWVLFLFRTPSAVVPGAQKQIRQTLGNFFVS